MNQKECIVCHEVKPLTGFHRHKQHADGRHGTCRVCRNQLQRLERDQTRVRPYRPWRQVWPAFLELAALETDECVIWPFGRDRYGYGKITDKESGRQMSPHRLALERRQPPPGHDLDAAHGPCHNRLCINYRHLYWATRKENQADRLRDGTVVRDPYWLWAENGEPRRPRAKVNKDVVREIRQLYVPRKVTIRELSERFGLSMSAVGEITRGGQLVRCGVSRGNPLYCKTHRYRRRPFEGGSGVYRRKTP